MDKEEIKLASPEDERMNYCAYTITNKHMWRKILLHFPDHIEPYYEKVTKCIACNVINDYDEST